MKLILKETLSDIVYHMTYIDSLLDILKSNQFGLTARMGSPADSQFSDYLYYFSVATSKWAGYSNKFSPSNIATLVLDGRKFSQRYKGVPVDYWGHDFRKRAIDPTIGPVDAQAFHKNDEQEQRVISNEPFIPNASSYIKEIHLCLGDFSLPYTNDKETWGAFFDKIVDHEKYNFMKRIESISKIKEIPVFVYLDYSAFKSLNKRKAYNLTEKGSIGFSFIKTILKLYYGKEMSEYERSDARDIRRSLDEYSYNLENGNDPSSGPAVRGFSSRLNNDIHHMRKDQVERTLVDSLMELYRKNKITKVWEIVGVLLKVLKKRHGEEWLDIPYLTPYRREQNGNT